MAVCRHFNRNQVVWLFFEGDMNHKLVLCEFPLVAAVVWEEQKPGIGCREVQAERQGCPSNCSENSTVASRTSALAGVSPPSPLAPTPSGRSSELETMPCYFQADLENPHRKHYVERALASGANGIKGPITSSEPEDRAPGTLYPGKVSTQPVAAVKKAN